MKKQSLRHRIHFGKSLGTVFILGITLAFAALIVLGIGLYRGATRTPIVRNPNLTTKSELAKIAAANKTGDNLYPCPGNAGDICKQTPTMPIWPNESMNSKNTAYLPTYGESKHITGKIQSHNDEYTIIRSSSGRLFILRTPVDVVTDFNNVLGPNYSSPISTGDTVFVDYNEPANTHTTDIATSQVHQLSLVLKHDVSSDGTLDKY